MADLISGLKFTVFSASNEESFVPLRRLLITDIAIKDTRVVKKGSQESEDPEKDAVKSRRASRSQRRNRSSPAGNLPNNGSASSVADLRAAQIRRVQENNNRVLIEIQQSLDEDDITSRTLAASPDADGLIADVELPPRNRYDSGEIAPVVLSLVDFLPAYNNGEPTSALKSLELKRAVRMLNVDLQTPDSMSDRIKGRNDMLQITVAQALSDHLRARSEFYRSLKSNERNMPLYDTILSHLSLVDEGASSTEVIYTFLRDLSASIKVGTPRLTEMEDRRLSRGARLPAPAISSTGGSLASELYAKMKREWSRNPISAMTLSMPDDNELFVKSLAALLGKETLYSRNIVNDSSEYSKPGGKELDPNLFDPDILLGINSDQVTLVPQPRDSNKTACGILYRDRIDLQNQSTQKSNSAENYPYEVRKIGRPLAAGEAKEVNTAPKFVKDEYFKHTDEVEAISYVSTAPLGSTTKTQFSSPYEAVKDSFDAAAQKLMGIMAPAPLTDTAIDRVFRQIIEITHITLRMAQDHDITTTLQPKVFEMAATDDKLLAHLLIYLAFRQEKKENYSGAGSPPPGASQLLRKSTWLNRNRLLNAGSSTIQRQQRISPTTVTVSPAIGGQSIFTSPEQATTIGIELEAGTNDSGTLESIYSVTFEQIADEVGASFYYAITDNAPTQDEVVNFLAGEGFDLPITIGIMQSMFRHLEDTNGPHAEDMFDCCLRYTEHMNGHDGLPIYGPDVRTVFGSIDREVLFGSFVYLLSALQKLILPGVGYELRGQYVGDEPGTPGHGNIVRIRKTPGYATKVAELGQFVNDPAGQASSLAKNFPELARIYSELAVEQQAIGATIMSLHQYFTHVQNKYLAMKATLDVEIDPIHRGAPRTTLGESLARGLIPSFDVVKLLNQYPERFNNEAMFYGSKKVNDNTISNKNFAAMHNILRDDPVLNANNSSDVKIMCVGVPAGLLESLEYVPSDFGDVDQNSRLKPDTFSVVVQKIDESNPQIVFDEIEFEFSRSLFIRNLSPTYGASFTLINNELISGVANETQLSAVFTALRAGAQGANILENHKKDYFFKQYLDLQHDLDLNENAFPISQEALRESISNEIRIRAFDSVDFKSQDFLSGSNMAFSKESTPFESMPFYNRRTMSLDIRKKNMVDPYRYSAFDFANTYGVLFDGPQETRKLQSGVIFERTVCVAFKDSDFGIRRVIPPDIDTSGLSDEAAAEATKQSEARAYEEADIAVDTATTKLVTYRAYVKLGDRNIISSLGARA